MDIDVNKRGEQRNFGLVMAAACVVVGGLRWFVHGFAAFPWGFVTVAAVFLALSLFLPRVLKPVLIVWLRFALLLNWVMTRVILTLAFYLLVTPVGVAMRLFGNDPLNRAWKPGADTYWEDAEEQPDDLERYRNQF